MKVATLKSAYNSLIIGPRGYGYEANLLEIMGWDSRDVVIFDLTSGGNDLVSGGNELVSGWNDLVNSGNKLLTGQQFSKWWERVSKWWE